MKNAVMMIWCKEGKKLMEMDGYFPLFADNPLSVFGQIAHFPFPPDQQTFVWL
jgi:hypothetical protein